MLRVAHVVECFAAGTAHFINLLTQYTSCEHIVIHGERADELSAEIVKSKFPKGTKFIHWQNVQREIRPIKDYRALTELISILKNLPEVDIVHLHSSKAGFLGRAACRLLGFNNVIYTPNGASFARADISSFKKSLYVLLEKIAAKMSGQVVCCSHSESLSFKDIGIASTYINNGTILPNTALDNINFPISEADNTFTIVTCGRVTEQKNPNLFNRIAAYYEEQHRVKFVWIGEGTSEQKALLKANNIYLTGWLPKNEVDHIISRADLYISTSLWEGLPFSVLEALSLGKCLLLTNCVGNVDLVQEAHNGYTFDKAEEAIARIDWFLQNREALQIMGQKSMKLSADKFDIRKVSKLYQELYSKLSAPKSMDN
ncbi:glycosyltransferase family 4 protein [Pontibacter saemangeumensis]|uniref:Glycosyltransferase family 4 protein n=1 Tax=Pontibacter saemangeumensis TaxID=1084525 RepID=A0ABP8LG23_9BACT